MRSAGWPTGAKRGKCKHSLMNWSGRLLLADISYLTSTVWSRRAAKSAAAASASSSPAPAKQHNAEQMQTTGARQHRASSARHPYQKMTHARKTKPTFFFFLLRRCSRGFLGRARARVLSLSSTRPATRVDCGSVNAFGNMRSVRWRRGIRINTRQCQVTRFFLHLRRLYCAGVSGNMLDDTPRRLRLRSISSHSRNRSAYSPCAVSTMWAARSCRSAEEARRARPRVTAARGAGGVSGRVCRQGKPTAEVDSARWPARQGWRQAAARAGSGAR